jgi:hypothetical protein
MLTDMNINKLKNLSNIRDITIEVYCTETVRFVPIIFMFMSMESNVTTWGNNPMKYQNPLMQKNSMSKIKV